MRADAITITREGCGSGEAKALSPGEAHEIALKAAETDATKRALATFGNPFGLALYDGERNWSGSCRGHMGFAHGKWRKLACFDKAEARPT